MRSELFPGKHLFVDDHRIEQMTAARRVLNRPQKRPRNPVMVGETPWEARGIGWPVYGAYDRQRGVLRFWYASNGRRVYGTRVIGKDNPPFEVYETYLCYAETADYVQWERPALGIVDYEGSTANNIVLPSRQNPGTVEPQLFIEDPLEADPQRRFKLQYLDRAGEGQEGSGLGPDQKLRLHAFSPDGIHWERLPWRAGEVGRLFMVVRYLDIEPSGVINPDARYIQYGQRGSPWRTRQVGRRDSDNFLDWSENRPVLESSFRDPPGEEFYYMAGANLNQTYAGLHLGVLGIYRTNLAHPFDPTRNDGVTEAQLAYSRDSVRWERWVAPFLERGEPGAFDWGGVYAAYPIVTPDQLLFFYTATSVTHNYTCTPTLGLATLRLDGFVHVEADGFNEGTLTTRPFHWQAARLSVNADAAHGALRAQLQDETGRAIEGFTCADCDPIHADALDRGITWRGQGDVSALRDRMVAVKFFLSPETRLYAYTLHAT